jgi:uncharacterized membrane protein
MEAGSQAETVQHPALVRHEELRLQSAQARVADAITSFAGSMTFVYVHIVWFALWIVMGVEHYPFGLLTMVVSLEAIFLSTFVMISQNRADSRRQVLADAQWKTVQTEERQNEKIIDLSNQILELTTAIHKMTNELHEIRAAVPSAWQRRRHDGGDGRPCRRPVLSEASSDQLRSGRSPSTSFEQAREGVVVVFFVGQDALEKLLGHDVAVVAGLGHDAAIELDRALLVGHVAHDHLVQGGADEDRLRLGRGRAAQVGETLGDRLGVLHLGDANRPELILDGEALDAAPQHVLPDVLDGDLQLAGDGLVQQLQKLG